MSSVAESLNKRGNIGWFALAGMAALIIVAAGVPNLLRSRMAANQSHEYALREPVAARLQSEVDQTAFPKKMVKTELVAAGHAPGPKEQKG